MIGLLNLMYGIKIIPHELFSAYFCIHKKQFISGELALKPKHINDEEVFSLKKDYNLEEFSSEDRKIHACLWFSGKASTAKDNASKIVYYNSALELVAGKSLENFFQKIYKDKDLFDETKKILKKIKTLRGDLLHNGIPVVLESGIERHIHALIMDAIAYSTSGNLTFSATEKLLNKNKAT